MPKKEYRLEIIKTKELTPETYPNVLVAMSAARNLSIEIVGNVAVVKFENGHKVLLATFSYS